MAVVVDDLITLRDANVIGNAGNSDSIMIEQKCCHSSHIRFSSHSLDSKVTFVADAPYPLPRPNK